MGFNLCWRLLKCDNSSTGLLCSWNKIRWCLADWWFATDVPWQMRHLYLSTPIRATGSSRGHVPRFAEETVNWLSMQTLNCARVRASGLTADLKGRAAFSGAERYRWDWHKTQSLEIHCSVCAFCMCLIVFVTMCCRFFVMFLLWRHAPSCSCSFCLTWNDMKWHEMTWNDMKWHELTWIDMNWHELTWIDMNWHELTWNNPNCTKPTNKTIQITTKRQMTKNMSKSKTSHRHKKKLTTISPCVSWSKVGYFLGWSSTPWAIGVMVGWSYHVLFWQLIPSGNLTYSYRKSPFLIGKPSINGPFSIAMLVYQRVFQATNSTRCNVDWSIKSW